MASPKPRHKEVVVYVVRTQDGRSLTVTQAMQLEAVVLMARDAYGQTAEFLIERHLLPFGRDHTVSVVWPEKKKDEDV